MAHISIDSASQAAIRREPRLGEQEPASRPRTMKAVVQHRYGRPEDVLALETINVPAIGAGEVLVRVHAAGVCYPDGLLTRGIPYVLRLAVGLRRPRNAVRGVEVAGTVVEVGANVEDLCAGDEVFGWCGPPGHARQGGGFAEYARCQTARITRKPPTVTFEQAASLPTSGVTALQAVRDWAQVKAGQRVLVNGASGGVGMFAVQIAKSLGAEVTGVCSAASADRVRSIGADTVIDYAREDFTRGARRYDAILDFPHFAQHSLRELGRALSPHGVIVPASNTRNRLIGGFSRTVPGRLIAPFVSYRVTAPQMTENRADLAALAELVAAGNVTPVIDRRYPLGDVPDALRYFAQGHTTGKLVIDV